MIILLFALLFSISELYSQGNEDNKNLKIVKNFFENGYAKRNYEVIYETISDDFTGYSNGIQIQLKGPEYQIKGIENEYKVHPDYNIKIDDIFPSITNKVTVRWTANWTDQKSGKVAALFGIWIAEVKDGKIIKGWNIFDLLGTSKRLKKE